MSGSTMQAFVLAGPGEGSVRELPGHEWCGRVVRVGDAVETGRNVM